MSGNAFQDQPYTPTKTKSNSGCWIMGWIGGGFLVLVLICCGGGLGLVGVGMNIVEEDLKNQLRDHPQVREHIGEISKFDVNFVRSSAAGDDETFVYDVEGSIGSAEMTIKSSSEFDDDTETIVSAVMRLPSGEEFDLVNGDEEESP